MKKLFKAKCKGNYRYPISEGQNQIVLFSYQLRNSILNYCKSYSFWKTTIRKVHFLLTIIQASLWYLSLPSWVYFFKFIWSYGKTNQRAIFFSSNFQVYFSDTQRVLRNSLNGRVFTGSDVRLRGFISSIASCSNLYTTRSWTWLLVWFNVFSIFSPTLVYSDSIHWLNIFEFKGLWL